MVEIKIENMGVNFKNKTVLKNINANFKGGNIVSVIGPNGTGKTTFIKAVANMNKYTGEINILMDKKPLSKEKIAYVPQSNNSKSELTVFEMVLLGQIKDLKWKVSAEQLNKTKQMIKELNLTNIAHEPFSKLSGGQKQLVVMAQALISNPKVLLLDEPTSALDLKHQLQVLDIAQEYTKKTGALTFLVIHDLSLVARYSDCILLLNRGEIAGNGTPDEILETNLLEKVYQVEVDISKSNEGYITVTPVRASIAI
jgi:iron complex transport system ATP-binding protein